MTVCSAEKAADPEPMPARERYTAPRIRVASRKASEDGRPLFFLSGKHGLIAADAPIAWYDLALSAAEVGAMLPQVVDQLAGSGLDTLEFLARDRDTPGWQPYHDLLEAGCAEAGVALHLIAYEEEPHGA